MAKAARIEVYTTSEERFVHLNVDSFSQGGQALTVRKGDKTTSYPYVNVLRFEFVGVEA